MSERDPNIVTSGLSRVLVEDGVSAKLEIYRLEHLSEWSMELVTKDGSSIVWDDQFESDDSALATFERDKNAEGLRGLITGDNVIPFPRQEE